MSHGGCLAEVGVSSRSTGPEVTESWTPGRRWMSARPSVRDDRGFHARGSSGRGHHRHFRTRPQPLPGMVGSEVRRFATYPRSARRRRGYIIPGHVDRSTVLPEVGEKRTPGRNPRRECGLIVLGTGASARALIGLTDSRSHRGNLQYTSPGRGPATPPIPTLPRRNAGPVSSRTGPLSSQITLSARASVEKPARRWRALLRLRGRAGMIRLWMAREGRQVEFASGGRP
jgi:hypothetical protein